MHSTQKKIKSPRRLLSRAPIASSERAGLQRTRALRARLTSWVPGFSMLRFALGLRPIEDAARKDIAKRLGDVSGMLKSVLSLSCRRRRARVDVARGGCPSMESSCWRTAPCRRDARAPASIGSASMARAHLERPYFSPGRVRCVALHDDRVEALFTRPTSSRAGRVVRLGEDRSALARPAPRAWRRIKT